MNKNVQYEIILIFENNPREFVTENVIYNTFKDKFFRFSIETALKGLVKSGYLELKNGRYRKRCRK